MQEVLQGKLAQIDDLLETKASTLETIGDFGT